MLSEQTWTACDVCKLLFNDYTRKPCTWCPLCQAWLCAAHQGDYLLRLRAALRRHLGV